MFITCNIQVCPGMQYRYIRVRQHSQESIVRQARTQGQTRKHLHLGMNAPLFVVQFLQFDILDNIGSSSVFKIDVLYFLFHIKCMFYVKN